MSFITPAFLPLFAVVFALTWLWPRRAWQNTVLLAASAVFYGLVHPWFLCLLLFSAMLDYVSALGMTAFPEQKNAFLAASLVGNLGLLATFKYFNFFAENIDSALGALGWHVALPLLKVVLPVGISFYTFQTLSYSIDVWRGTLPARRSFLDYATFVCMFPHLVAGPVMRARDLLPQVERDRTLTAEAFQTGLGLCLWGAFQKLVCADGVASYVDLAYAARHADAPLIAAATLGFAVQILADFSGYTNMARGLARLLGLELAVNFAHPYLAATPMEFWRRWHISFSRWIHDYVYVPLGGSRHGPGRRAAATWTAMLASGTWHGASWNYVLWGAWHAGWITVYRWLEPRVPASLRTLGRAPAVAVWFTLTCAGWMLFRSTDLAVFARIAATPLPDHLDQTIAALVIFQTALLHASPLLVAVGLESRWTALQATNWRLPLRSTGYSLLLLGIWLFGRPGAREFVYFRF